ncbi:MAG: SDR family oxidoreductase [Pseudomonadota bacterium]
MNDVAKAIAGSVSAIIPDRFRDKVAIVTGGASGMGRAQAVRLAAEGASVAILDINDEGGRRTVDDINAAGGKAAYERTDVTSADQIEAGLAHVRERYGPANLLFNNAGTLVVSGYTDTTEEEFDRVMDTNVRSTFMVTKRVIPQLIEQSGGSIVIMSSVSAVRGFPLEAIYGVSKAAVQALMMNIAVEYREQGIRCNAVCPAFVNTPHGMREIDAFKALGIDWSDDDIRAAQLRICEPEDVSNVALFLASDDAGSLNGVAINVDNGWMAKA